MPSGIRVGVLGARGMLGSDLVRFLGSSYEVTGIDKENYESLKGASFDVLINANGNSRRFWADQNPLLDFEASTISVYKSLFDFSAGLYIYISSSDVYAEPRSEASAKEDLPLSGSVSPYGFHKRLSEEIVRQGAKAHLILRSSAILGTVLKKGPVYDILQGQPLFITPDSELEFVKTDAISEIIRGLIEKGVKNETVNMGGVGTFPFAKAKEVFGREITFSPEAKRQHYVMNTEKLKGYYPVKSSEEYLLEYLNEIRK